ncbi:STAS domain-containing protein [Pseudonocardia broussonetiae]|uniref:STAS domain-containing protein n=1 Tax=Pseudonocardia broussonetiae TaxID=2736640 RepID=A0A6M6JLJ1_9PSEU|nr:STAS domain-containing protein [Pseudonocardia broussonetiae]QJY48236.1 hypothetical protein HOP40_22565 [Pseudonocardia broussonetiae]
MRATVQLSVDVPDPAVRVLWVNGYLDVAGAARLVRVVESQLLLVTSGLRDTRFLLVDLSGVAGFDPAALDLLRCLSPASRAAGVELYLTGCSSRLLVLPLRVRQALARFSAYPTVESALRDLRPVAPEATTEVVLPAQPGPPAVEVGVPGLREISGLRPELFRTDPGEHRGRTPAPG